MAELDAVNDDDRPIFANTADLLSLWKYDRNSLIMRHDIQPIDQVGNAIGRPRPNASTVRYRGRNLENFTQPRTSSLHESVNIMKTAVEITFVNKSISATAKFSKIRPTRHKQSALAHFLHLRTDTSSRISLANRSTFPKPAGPTARAESATSTLNTRSPSTRLAR